MGTADYYEDKICIVTGANSGIGYALSEDLLNRGATVYMVGRNPEKVAKAAQQLAAHRAAGTHPRRGRDKTGASAKGD